MFDMKKKYYPGVIVILIIILVIAGYFIYTLISDNETLEDTPYTNTKYGWSMKYPLGWDFSEGVFGDADFKDKSADDIFLNIRVEPLPPYKTTTLEEEIDTMQEILNLENYSIISKRNREINYIDSYEFIYNKKVPVIMICHLSIMKNRINPIIKYVKTCIASRCSNDSGSKWKNAPLNNAPAENATNTYIIFLNNFSLNNKELSFGLAKSQINLLNIGVNNKKIIKP